MFITSFDTKPSFIAIVTLALNRRRPSLPRFRQTRPETRLPQSRAGEQEQCWRRSLQHLGRSSKFNSRKSVRWSAVPVPCLSRLCLKLREGKGQRPWKGRWPTLSHLWRIFSLFWKSAFGLIFWPPRWIWVSKLGFGLGGRDFGHRAGI